MACTKSSCTRNGSTLVISKVLILRSDYFNLISSDLFFLNLKITKLNDENFITNHRSFVD